MHLADAFIQRLYIFISMCSLGIEPTTFCAANAMLYHWATGTLANIFNMNNIFIFNNILNAIFSGLHCRNDSNILQSVIAISKALLTFDSNDNEQCVVNWFSAHMSLSALLHNILCNFGCSTGELQERWNSAVSEVRPSWKWLRTKISTSGEAWSERCERPPSVCVPQGDAASAQRRLRVLDGWSQMYHLESGEQEWRLLELWEVPHRPGRGTVQEIQQKVPHHRHWSRYQRASEEDEINLATSSCCGHVR